MLPPPSYGICWDLGDVIFSEETEVKTADGVTDSVTLVPGIGGLLGALARCKIPMAIVSDTRIGACENVLGPHGLEDCFVHRTISESLGVEKPHPAMFVSTCRALNLPPERMAMIGNHYYRDVEGANRVGMTTIWFHWNDRYPSPKVPSAADYIARDALELAAAIKDWVTELGPVDQGKP
ncbi:MAG TPA: HAD family hydrolase [Acidimicrobiales bacterium]|nr:HAD family hydrolase [Acidimicrobiales bacterium]